MDPAADPGYVAGVLEGEVPWTSADAALQAQGVAARTWSSYKCTQHLLNDGQHGLYDTGAAPYYDEEYWPDNPNNGNLPRMQAMAEATSGQYMTYQGTMIDAEFGSKNGDPTGDWTGSGYPYLVQVQDPVSTAEPCNCNCVGLGQVGAEHWAAGNDPTAANPLHPVWSTYLQILTHYYTGFDVVNASGTFFTPGYRWLPLSVGWSDGDQNVGAASHTLLPGDTYTINLTVQNAGTSAWSPGNFALGWLPINGILATVGSTVEPGATVTLQFSWTIPSTSGGPFQFEMYYLTPGGWYSFRGQDPSWPVYPSGLCITQPCG
jgi:hypothetical protein